MTNEEMQFTYMEDCACPEPKAEGDGIHVAGEPSDAVCLASPVATPTAAAHAEHEVVQAYSQDCIEGECDHIDEDDDGTLDKCPSIEFDVCVDCMDEKGAGRSEEEWDGLPLEPWPHPGSAVWTETAPASPDSGSDQ